MENDLFTLRFIMGHGEGRITSQWLTRGRLGPGDCRSPPITGPEESRGSHPFFSCLSFLLRTSEQGDALKLLQ